MTEDFGVTLMGDDRYVGNPTEDQMGVLMAPLGASRVSSRKQGGRDLSYLEAYDVKATLIRVFGFGGFSADVTDTKVLVIDRDAKKSDGGQTNEVMAQVTVRLRIHQFDATYTETAVASHKGPDIGEVTDFAVKTAASDALKRCAIYLGTQFGLGLYDNGSKAEIVRRVFAPGQEWPKKVELTDEQKAALAGSLGGEQQ